MEPLYLAAENAEGRHAGAVDKKECMEQDTARRPDA